MRVTIFLLGLCVLAGCGTKPGPVPTDGGTPSSAADDNAKAAAEIKALIPVAASMPAELVKRIAESPAVSPDDPEYRKLGSLTFAVMCLVPSPALEDSAQAEFDFGPGQINPSKIADGFSRSASKGYASVIQPEYITGFTCDVKGDTATGTVAFKVEKVYQGNVRYRASRTGGKWVIEEFQLPNWGVTITRVKDGEWSQKIEPPAIKTDDRLKGDVAKFRGTWMRKDNDREATRVVTGDTITETVTRDGRPEYKITSKFSLRFKGTDPTIVCHARKRAYESEKEHEYRDDRFGYRFDGDTWTELDRDDEKGWVEIGKWLRVKGK